MQESDGGRAPARLVVGLTGYPNVGKSSTINAVFGAKKTAVAATPGKTKHFQTLNVSPRLTFCDCPGLVLPTYAASKADLVAAGAPVLRNVLAHQHTSKEQPGCAFTYTSHGMPGDASVCRCLPGHAASCGAASRWSHSLLSQEHSVMPANPPSDGLCVGPGAGVIPIARLTDVRAPVEVVAQRISRAQWQQVYGVQLPRPGPGDDPGRFASPLQGS